MQVARIPLLAAALVGVQVVVLAVVPVRIVVVAYTMAQAVAQVHIVVPPDIVGQAVQEQNPAEAVPVPETSVSAIQERRT